MGKWFEVTVTTVKVIAVEVEDGETEDDATRYAIDEVGDFDEAKCSDEITGEIEIDRLKRHADEILAIT